MKNRTDVDVKKQTTLVENTEGVNSKRRFISGAAPAVVALLSIPAFGARGAVCSISGMQSVNPSGHTHITSGCGGLSPGAWKTPYSANGDASLYDWHQAGMNYYNMKLYPNPGSSNGSSNSPNYIESTEDATLFSDIFYAPGDTESLHDKLHDQGNAFHRSTVEAFLNAAFFNWGEAGSVAPSSIHAIDVVGLYNATPGSSYTTVSGSIVTVPSDANLHTFFYNLIH